MKAKVVEIFRSIQGEGKYIGVQQVFVRLYGCNMFCRWCDTPHSIGAPAGDLLKGASPRFSEYSTDDLYHEIQKLWKHCHSVSFTGGEPLVQVDVLENIFPKLKAQGQKIFLETNGLLPENLSKVVHNINTISMDFKLPSSTKDKSYWDEHEAFLKVLKGHKYYLKVVITQDTDEKDIDKMIDVITSVNKNSLLIYQPNTYDLGKGVLDKCLTFYEKSMKRLEHVRVIPQVHKFLKIR